MAAVPRGPVTCHSRALTCHLPLSCTQAETFVALEGALAFFTWPHQGDTASPGTEPGAPQCHILQPGGAVRAVVVEVGQWHAMTAAPRALGYPGHAIVMEISGHRFDPAAAGKTLAPFAPALEGGINGDPAYFAEQLLPLCPRAGATSTLAH